LACGSNGEMISHSPSAISLGYAFRVILEELQLLDLFLSSNDVIARFRPLYISLETASKPGYSLAVEAPLKSQGSDRVLFLLVSHTQVAL
jgi:hypothetical protein